MYQEKYTQPQTCYPDHQESTKEKMTTQMSHSSQNPYLSDSQTNQTPNGPPWKNEFDKNNKDSHNS